MKAPSRLRPFGYQALMPHLVGDILMVASPYDSFIMEEEGRFSDRLLEQYVAMDLATPPHFAHVTTAQAALRRLARDRFDLVLTTPHFAGMRPKNLAARIAKKYPETSVVMLTYDQKDAQIYSQVPRSKGIHQTFLWTGDPALLVGLVKAVEDMRNVDHDTREGKVRVIIVVEDSPSFYSSYLPAIYRELLSQTHSLIAERLNEKDRRHRMRARPRILLARSYEEAKEFLDKYQKFLLGVICDMRFPRRGTVDPFAGRHLIERMRRKIPGLPILLQSRETEHAALAEELAVSFADKNSPELLTELGIFMRNNFGFGSFVFRDGAGREVGHADDLVEMLDVLRSVPKESLRHHGERNEISNWLMARSEFALALEVRPRKVSDFHDLETLRGYLIGVFSNFLERRQKGEVTVFSRRVSSLTRDFTRIGRGSMGGKARSIAFLSNLLVDHPIHQHHPAVSIKVPRTAVICTELYDEYMARNGMRERAMEATTDEEVVDLFLAQPLDEELMADLAALVSKVQYPLAVRSSSLHEDSEFAPLAGFYRTFMLPNMAPDPRIRLEALSRAIRLIYASVYFQGVRSYMKASSLRIEEEKMAVIVQRLVGYRYGPRFYPNFSGVAQSLNYYPMGKLKIVDGLATVALGLGQTIVGGRRALRFSPKHPRILPQMASPKEALQASQTDFYALTMAETAMDDPEEEANLVLLDLKTAEEDGTLAPVGATFVADEDRIYDTIHRPGARLVNFAGVLKHGLFPLAPILGDLLKLGEHGMATPVEMEFAVALDPAKERPPELAVLQLRPLVAESREVEVDLEPPGQKGSPLLAGTALGNGIFSGIRDIVYIHPDRLDLSHSVELADAVGQINQRLLDAGRPYLLASPGRWGTSDPFLGIPVQWTQVSGARVIVEMELPGIPIDPSQGTHFFHNLISLHIGYFGVNLADPDHCMDLEGLESLPAEEERLSIRHVVLEQPVEARINGREGRGVVIRRVPDDAP